MGSCGVAESSRRCSVTSQRGGMGGEGRGREDQEEGDVCTLTADSCCPMADTTQCCKAIVLQLKTILRNKKEASPISSQWLHHLSPLQNIPWALIGHSLSLTSLPCPHHFSHCAITHTGTFCTDLFSTSPFGYISAAVSPLNDQLI